MKISTNDLSLSLQSRKEEFLCAFEAVIDSGQLMLGQKLSQFECAFADYLGVEHCVGVANGTDAIELSFRALGIGVGQKVATVANAGMYTLTAINSIGADPFFLDVDLDTRNVSLAEVNRALEAGVNAVVVTHLFGLAVPEIEEIAIACKRSGVPLLEDCAQAHGARANGRCVGGFGDIASFSFYPTKNLGALGDGGAIVTGDFEIASYIRKIRQYGWSSKYKVEIEGGRNSRLDEIQAAILLTLLPDLDKSNDRRRIIAAYYSEHIKNPNVITPTIGGPEFVAHLYVIRTKQRDLLRSYLEMSEVMTDIHYPIPDHQQSVFEDRFVNISLPNTERLSREMLTLPCYPDMKEIDVSRVVEVINGWWPESV